MERPAAADFRNGRKDAFAKRFSLLWLRIQGPGAALTKRRQSKARVKIFEKYGNMRERAFKSLRKLDNTAGR